jgi:hypothetical protein
MLSYLDGDLFEDLDTVVADSSTVGTIGVSPIRLNTTGQGLQVSSASILEVCITPLY